MRSAIANNFYSGKPTGSNPTDILDSVSPKEFLSYERSTMPFLAWWTKFPDQKWENKSEPFLKSLKNLYRDDQAQFCIEYPVKPQNGTGKASMTDLMIMSENQTVAVEGKWREKPYPLVKDWAGASENRKDVLEGWLRSLNPSVRIEDCESVEYQIIHRAASAVISGQNRGETALIYQCFYRKRTLDDPAPHKVKIHKFIETVKPKNIAIYFVTTPLELNLLDEKKLRYNKVKSDEDLDTYAEEQYAIEAKEAIRSANVYKFGASTLEPLLSAEE